MVNIKKKFRGTKSSFSINHDGAEISLIWFVERSAIKLLILCVAREKKTLRSKEILMIALFGIRFQSLFFGVKKRRQYSEVTTIAWDLRWQLCSIDEMLLGRIEIGINWWLTSNSMISRAILSISLTRASQRN